MVKYANDDVSTTNGNHYASIYSLKKPEETNIAKKNHMHQDSEELQEQKNFYVSTSDVA